MAICLEYQSVLSSRKETSTSLKYHLAASLLLLGALVTRVTIKMETTKVGYELARERSREVELDMSRRELELARSVMYRPDNLSSAARALGLTNLNVDQARRIRY